MRETRVRLHTTHEAFAFRPAFRVLAAIDLHRLPSRQVSVPCAPDRAERAFAEFLGQGDPLILLAARRDRRQLALRARFELLPPVRGHAAQFGLLRLPQFHDHLAEPIDHVDHCDVAILPGRDRLCIARQRLQFLVRLSLHRYGAEDHRDGDGAGFFVTSQSLLHLDARAVSRVVETRADEQEHDLRFFQCAIDLLFPMRARKNVAVVPVTDEPGRAQGREMRAELLAQLLVGMRVGNEYVDRLHHRFRGGIRESYNAGQLSTNPPVTAARDRRQAMGRQGSGDRQSLDHPSNRAFVANHGGRATGYQPVVRVQSSAVLSYHSRVAITAVPSRVEGPNFSSWMTILSPLHT